MSVTTYGVIGHPLGHTMSPFIHARLFALLGSEYPYLTRDIPPEKLATAIPALCREVAGFNVTIPHKQAIIPHLTRLEGRAKLYRSVNTVAVTPAGAVGYNTDAEGLLQALKAAGVPMAGRVAILGCGGVSRTFACEAALTGCQIVNAVRPESVDRAVALREFVTGLVPEVDYTITTLDGLAGDFDLLLNGTPVGMYPHPDASPVTAEQLSGVKAVFDAVYNPRETRLLRLAGETGAITVGGMAMLVWQAAVAQSIWLGREHDPAAVAQVIDEALLEMERRFYE